MLIRSLRAFWAVLALMLVLPQAAEAGSGWRVTDIISNQVLIAEPGGPAASPLSILPDVVSSSSISRSYRVEYINNTGLWPRPLGTCSATTVGPLYITISNQPGQNIWPGGSHLIVQHQGSHVGWHEVLITCPSAFQFTVRGRMLDPNPSLILETAAGVSVGKLSTFNFTASSTVTAGTPRDQDFRITNFGNQALTLSHQVSGAGFSVVTAPPASLAAGAQATFRLRFQGTSAATFNGELRLNNNDPNDNPYRVYLSGTATAATTPQIRITDNGNGGAVVVKNSTVSIGSTTANTAITRTFTITNVGSGTLTISNPSALVTGSGWTLASAPSSTSLGANQSTTFTARYQGGSLGTFQGTASVASNDPDDNPFAFTLQAQVAAPAPHLRVVNESSSATLSSGTQVSLGSTQQGSLIYQSFRLYNDGSAPLQLIGSPTLSGSNGYTFQDQPSLTILPKSWTRVSVLFQSSTLGAHNGSITIGHNDTSSTNPFVINLTANVIMAALPVVRLTASDIETSESSNNGQFTITRTGSTAGDLPVNVTVSGSAQNGADFQTIGPSYTIPAGQPSINVALTPINDSAIEDVETVTLSLATGQGYTIGSPNSATFELTNNDYTPCIPAASRLCLQNGRFELTLVGRVGTNEFTGQAVPLGTATGGFWLFSSNNLEVAVKVLDGSALNGRYWVYYGGATDVDYTLTVKDLANLSRTKDYGPTAPFCGAGDTGQFDKSMAVPLSKEELEIAPEAGEWGQSYDKAFTCTPNATTTCLLGNRFQVRVRQGSTYREVFHSTADTGFFWFYSPENMEVFIKVLDATALPGGKYWVFWGSLTDQGYIIEVTDSTNGAFQDYPNPGPMCGGSDLAAF